MSSYFKEVGKAAYLNFDVKRGTICAAKVNNAWHRVRIQDIFIGASSSVYNCLLLDCGIFEDLQLEE